MALGDVTERGYNKTIELLASATATNSAPASATAGIDMNSALTGSRMPPAAGILIKSTAGSGTMTVTLKLWAYNTAAAVWAPCGTGSDGTAKGILNEGSAITEISADLIRHFEVVNLPAVFDRLYLEITAIGGTSTAITAYLIVPTQIIE
jgi:hypothetical protein